MIDQLRTAVFWICGAVLFGGVLVYIWVSTGSGGDIFGESEGTLQPTNFALLTYDGSNPGYLLCPASLCENAFPDGNAATFAVDPSALRLALVDFADDNPAVKTRSFDLATNQFEYTERLPGRSFPAVVSIRIIEVGEQPALAIYSYQPIGDSSAKEHEERVARWLRIIRERL